MLNNACWDYVLNWLEKNAYLGWTYKRYGWTTSMNYEDFKQQMILIGVETYSKLSAGGKEVTDKEFENKLIWGIRTYCWGNREKVRGKDIGNGEDNEDAVVTLNFEDIADYYNNRSDDDEEDEQYNQAKLKKHEMMTALLSYLTVTEGEYLSEYLGIGDSPKHTMKEIGNKHGVTESAVSQLIGKAKKRLIDLLRYAGIDNNKTQKEIADAISKMYLSESYEDDYEYKSFPAEYMEYEFIKVREPFRSVCPISEQILYSIAKSINTHGYDQSQPLIIWKETGVLLDGHTRLSALKLAKYEGKVPVVPVSMPDLKSALAYVLNIQYNRRNVKDADIISSAERIFSLFHTNKTSDKEKTMLLAKVCAELPIVKIKKVVALLNYAKDSEKSEVNSEKITINELYGNLKGRFSAKRQANNE
jgi:ParB-like chromosome segregation protein Spo0J